MNKRFKIFGILAVIALFVNACAASNPTAAPATDAPVITVRHLLTHAAGFPEDNPWGDRQLADTDKELLELIQNVSFLILINNISIIGVTDKINIYSSIGNKIKINSFF